MKCEYLSVSRCRQYLECPRRYWFTYEEGIRSDADHLKFGRIIHRTLEEFHRGERQEDILDIFERKWRNEDLLPISFYQDGREILRRYTDDPDNFRFPILKDEHGPVLEREVRVEVAPGVPLVAVFDRIDEISDDTIEVVDYKTSRVPLDEYELEDDLQLKVYALVARKLYPQYEQVITTLNYLRHGRVSTLALSEEDEVVADYLAGVYERILSDNDPKPRINGFCSWCEGKDRCDAYQSVGRDSPGDLAEERRPEEIWRAYDRVSSSIRLLEKRKRDLVSRLRDAFRQMDVDSFTFGDREVYLAANTRTYYDFDKVARVVPHKDLHKVVYVKSDELEHLLAKDRDSLDYLKVTARRSFGPPIIRSRKARG